MLSLGDFPTSAIVHFKWTTTALAGESITRGTDGTLRIYKGSSLVQRSSAVGITETEDFDTLTGVHHVAIDLADNTDNAFYQAGNEYQVVMAGMVIDGKTVNATLAHFSIERAGGMLALLKTIISGAGVNVTQLGGVTQSLTDLKDLADTGYDPAAHKIQGVVLTDTTTTYTGNTVQTGDSFARLGATGSGLTSLATQASVNTIDDLLDTEIPALTTAVGLIKAVTDLLPNGGALTSLATQASVTTIDDMLDTEIPAIIASLAVIEAFNNLSSAQVASLLQTALLDLANGIETGLTMRQALRLQVAACAGKASGLATATAVYRNAVADSKNRLTATVDADGNRSAVVYDLT